MQLSHHEWPIIIVGVMWVRLKTKWVYNKLFPKKTYGLLREHVREDFPHLSCCLAPGASGEEVPSQREAVSQDAFLVIFTLSMLQQKAELRRFLVRLCPALLERRAHPFHSFGVPFSAGSLLNPSSIALLIDGMVVNCSAAVFETVLELVLEFLFPHDHLKSIQKNILGKPNVTLGFISFKEPLPISI